MPIGSDNRLAIDVSWLNYLRYIHSKACSQLGDFAWRPKMTDIFTDKPDEKVPSNAILAKYVEKVAELTSPDIIEGLFIEQIANRQADNRSQAFADVSESF